ncbi:MAG TPA: alanine--glyoxylate aminotransferase family protein [Patescibacteria group bacterium]|nr:alanine--glyoxylate aminotransferase family protein [Patescibacteria group bacterium]
MSYYDFNLLFTPGPTNVPYRVLEAGSRPMLHHRTAEFSKIVENSIYKMKEVFGTKEDVLMVHTTGRGAMEGALKNLFQPGEEILSICNGKFGEMFADIGETIGLKVTRTCTNWLEPIQLEVIEKELEANAHIRGVTITHCDTSTGVANPIEQIGEVVRKHGRLLIVDCVSSLGCMEFKFDEWRVDVALTASQKGLMSPTGISFVAINERAWDVIEKSNSNGYYINFKEIKKEFGRLETPGSTPTSLAASVNESLNMIFEEGLENVLKRHETISIAIKECMPAIGLELFPKGLTNRSHSLTVLKVPEGISSEQIVTMAKEYYGIQIAGGLGKYKDTTIRIGHMGYIREREALLIIAALEDIMHRLGYTESMGRALKIFNGLLTRVKVRG